MRNLLQIVYCGDILPFLFKEYITYFPSDNLYGNKEIDFVAIKQGEKMYIQVAYDISEQKTFDREVSPLLDIKDAFPKMLIARTYQPEYKHEGIRIIDVAEWLRNDGFPNL